MSVSRGRSAWAMLLLAGIAGACERHEFEPPPEGARTSFADSLYTAALFDTVHWETEEARLIAGASVYGASCRRCHGYLGRGDTEYAADEGLRVPSLVEAGWPLAGSIEAVRHRIFTGHPAGMPTFGLSAVTPREIDAAAAYVLLQLRPEVSNRAAP